VNNQDGGQPGGNIRQVFFFRTDRGLTFVDKPGAASTTANTVLADGTLQFSPGRIDPTNPAFDNSRKPLAGEFVFHEQLITVIGNHLNSKGGDQPLYGPVQPPVLGSEAQRDRQAAIIRDFATRILTANPGANVIIAGDLNDFQFSNPLNILRDKQGNLSGSQVFSLLSEDPRVANAPYSYDYEGNAQDIDHVLYSQGLAGKLVTPTIVHINSEFYDSFSGRGSDHEPLTAVFDFPLSCNNFLVTSNLDNGAGGCGTLSNAINHANSSLIPVTISFNTNLVNVMGSLPALNGANNRVITLDGSCTPDNPTGRGVPGVRLAGVAGLPAGLVLGDYTKINGLKITGFTDGYALRVTGRYNRLTCNWLGTADGITAAANGGGLRISVGGGAVAANNILGQAGLPSTGNLIAGNSGVGILVEKGLDNTSGADITLYNTLVGYKLDGLGSLKNSGGAIRALAAGKLIFGAANRVQ
jgi:hypothetical protein